MHTPDKGNHGSRCMGPFLLHLGQMERLLLLPPSRYPAVPPAVAVEVAVEVAAEETVAAVLEPAYLQVTAGELAQHRE